jgi:hypothetical protein
MVDNSVFSLFLFTIGDYYVIDELSTVIGINPQNWKGEERTRWRGARTASWLRSKRGRHSVQPVATSVSESRIQVPALDVCATMGHQVHLQKAGSDLLPLLEGADRDLLLEQGSGSRRGEAALASFALGTQEAIGRRRAHGKQLPSALLQDVEVLMSF